MALKVQRSGAGEPVVLLHGWGMNSGIWGDAAHMLEERCDVYKIDLPGHGVNADVPVPGSLEAWAEAVLEVTPEKAVWIGWSLGGMVAQQAALLEPRRIAALMMVTSTPCFVERQGWPAGMKREVLLRFSEELFKEARKTLLRFLGLQVRGATKEREILRYLKSVVMESPLPSIEALENGLQLLDSVDLRPAMEEFGVPSLWLFGGKDTLVSAKTAMAVDSLLPDAGTCVISASGHAPFLSHPHAFLQQLAGLIDELDRRSANA